MAAFRKELHADLESLQRDLDELLLKCNTKRPNRGKHCEGRTPMETSRKGGGPREDDLLI